MRTARIYSVRRRWRRTVSPRSSIPKKLMRAALHFSRSASPTSPGFADHAVNEAANRLGNLPVRILLRTPFSQTWSAPGRGGPPFARLLLSGNWTLVLDSSFLQKSALTLKVIPLTIRRSQPYWLGLAAKRRQYP